MQKKDTQRGIHMSMTIDVLDPQKPKRIAIVASNPSVSKQTGWPIGFWWSELTHPYWSFVEHGYQVEIFSPDGGRLEADGWSDPRDESKDSPDDLTSLVFIDSPSHRSLVENSKPINQLNVPQFDAVLFVGAKLPCTPIIKTIACMSWRLAVIAPVSQRPFSAM